MLEELLTDCLTVDFVAIAVHFTGSSPCYWLHCFSEVGLLVWDVALLMKGQHLVEVLLAMQSAVIAVVSPDNLQQCHSL